MLETGEPRSETIDLGTSEPGLRVELRQGCLTDGAVVPIRLDGKIHGVLAASGCGHAISPGVFARLVTLGNLTDLALASASAHELLEEQARTDPLTGLANRRELHEAFERISGRQPFAFLAIDLDDLKSTNDGWGHAAGDAAIVVVASALASVVRRGDTVARPGGDEFAVLMLEATVEGAERLAKRIYLAISRIVLISGPPSLSIGCCVASAGAAPSLVQGAADAALYEAKHRGGGRIVIRSLAVIEPTFAVEAGSGCKRAWVGGCSSCQPHGSRDLRRDLRNEPWQRHLLAALAYIGRHRLRPDTRFAVRAGATFVDGVKVEREDTRDVA